MTPAELRAAIEKPAAQGGWDLEPGLVNLFLETWPTNRARCRCCPMPCWKPGSGAAGALLTLAGYRGSGRRARRHRPDRRCDLRRADAGPAGVARNIFLRLTALGEGEQDTRRRVPLAELASLADVETVLQKLEDARLVTAVREGEPDAAQPLTFVDVTHEALIREWPRLREWLAEDREGLRLQRKLTEAAQEWAASGREPGMQYRGRRLEQAQEWAAGHADALNELEREFLAASVEQMDAERREQERIAQEREAARAAGVGAGQKARRTVMMAAGGTLVVLALAVSWAGCLYQENQALEGERLLKEARQLKGR